MVRIWHFHHCGQASVPGLETEITHPAAACHSPPPQKNKTGHTHTRPSCHSPPPQKNKTGHTNTKPSGLWIRPTTYILVSILKLSRWIKSVTFNSVSSHPPYFLLLPKALKPSQSLSPLPGKSQPHKGPSSLKSHFLLLPQPPCSNKITS